MSRYLSDDVILDMSSKVQKHQGTILKAGYPCHIDATVIDDPYDPSRHRIGIDCTIFSDSSIIKFFEFNAYDSIEELEEQYQSLVKFVSAIS